MVLPVLAAFDVDGTLLRSDHTCSDRTQKALQRLRAAGVTVVMATGRPLAIRHETLELVGPVDFVVMGNGADTIDMSTGEVLRSVTVPVAIIDRVITVLRSARPDLGIALDTPSGVLQEDGFAERVPPAAPVTTYLDALDERRRRSEVVTRLALFDRASDDLDTLDRDVQRLVDDRVDAVHGGFPVVEVVAAGVDKGPALRELAEHLDVAAADTIAFGDGLNDLGMFSWTGTAVAMANATEAVRASADVIADLNDDDGVAGYIENVLGV